MVCRAPAEQIFKIRYEAGCLHTICYATSKDGLAWERPAQDVNPGTNQVLPPDLTPDGIHWTNRTATGDTGDRSTMFYNPFRKKKCIYRLRWGFRGRSRHYWEADDFLAGAKCILATCRTGPGPPPVALSGAPRCAASPGRAAIPPGQTSP